jgi:hypothetical protein
MIKPPAPTEGVNAETDRASLMALIEKHYQVHVKSGRHWLGYHFSKPSIFGLQLLMALATCELGAPGLGFQLAKDLAEIPYAQGEKGQQMFEHLLQKLFEITVLRTLVSIDWPDGTAFSHEPVNPTSKKRPELVVNTPERVFLFEVKCPGLLDHQRQRHKNSRQFPARSLLSKEDIRERALTLFEGGVTLPQDNKLKDFLVSAEAKFAGFQAAKPQTGVLVVAWDGFMYEPISSFNHVESGLFTASSFHRDKAGDRIPFAAVDGVLILNHLTLMHRATHEKHDQHRPDVFVLEPNCPSPNVWCPNLGGGGLPDHVLKAFDAVPAESMAMFADYAPTEFVMWLDPRSYARNRAARQRKAALIYGVCEGPLGRR